MKNRSSRNDKKTAGKVSSNIGSSSLGARDRYLLERDRIKGEIGGLDQIRETLGLSQRRACQLLLVDPSAWTRWNKTEAPPHVYQALKWLLELKKVNPNAAGPSDLTTRIDYVQSSTHSKLREIEQNVSMLERAVALTPSVSSHDLTSLNEEVMKSALAAQELRFQAKISNLEAKIEALLSRSLRKVKRSNEASKKSKKPLKMKSQKTKPLKKVSKASKVLRARKSKNPKESKESKKKKLASRLKRRR